MKHSLTLLTALFLAFNLFAQEKKAVFVIVDGIPADLIKKLNTPVIDSISKEGGFRQVIVGGEKNGYSQTPTISAVGYNTILTGTWVNKHNVWDNDIADPNYNYKTIFKFLKEYDNTKKIGIFSSWLDNRTKLVNMPFDYQVDSLELDTARFPHDKLKKFMAKIDQAVTDSAAEYIRTKAPDLSWVYLEYTDDMGHIYGDSPEFNSSIEEMDKKIGQLWDAIRYRQKEFNEQWLLVVTTDHGRDDETGNNHGGQSDRERAGWIATNAKDLNNYFKTGNPSIADILPTIVSFMGINIEKADSREIDGVPLIGKIGASDMKAAIQNGKLVVQWKKGNVKGDAKIWITTTNNYKTGGIDEYQLIKTVSLSKEKVAIDISKYPSSFYKVVMETPVNYLNRWVSTGEKQN